MGLSSSISRYAASTSTRSARKWRSR
jgi:hypothetical protein